MKTNGRGTRTLNVLKRFLEHRHLPVILAMGAILVMLPALKMGLVLDDLPERAVALRPDQFHHECMRQAILQIPALSRPSSGIFSSTAVRKTRR